MSKHPAKKEAVDGKAGGVEATSSTDAGVAAPSPAEPAAAPEPKMTFSSARPVSLADLNASAYSAHKSDGELKKRAAEAAQRAIADVLGKAGV